MRLQFFDLMDEMGAVGAAHWVECDGAVDIVVTYLDDRAAVDWLNT